MSQPTLPDTVTADLVKMNNAVSAAWNSIKREEATLLSRWPGETKPVRLQNLRNLQSFMTDTSLKILRATNEAPGILGKAYEIGGWGTALKVGTEASFALPDLDAIAVMSKEVSASLLSATTQVSQQAKSLVNEFTGGIGIPLTIQTFQGSGTVIGTHKGFYSLNRGAGTMVRTIVPITRNEGDVSTVTPVGSDLAIFNYNYYNGYDDFRALLIPQQQFFSRVLLPAPVTKDSTNTMKVIYEFTIEETDLSV